MALQKITSWAERIFSPDKVVLRRFNMFQSLLREDRKCLKLITKLEEIHHRPIPTDWSRIAMLVQALSTATHRLIDCLVAMRPGTYDPLTHSHSRISADLTGLLPEPEIITSPPYALPLDKAWEHPQMLGGKALALSRIRKETRIPVQPGFVITTNAFHAFLEENNLQQVIARGLRGLNLQRPDRLRKISDSLQRAVMAGKVPDIVQTRILAAIQDVAGTDQSTVWAVRSSASAEDGEVSFAGQYATVLDVRQEDICEAYKTVLASKYAPRALTYRLHYGLDDNQTPMAVLVLPMIAPRASGVMYTMDPLDMCKGSCLVITAVPGLGTRLVDGSAVPDIFLISRNDPKHFLAKQPAPEEGSSGTGSQNAQRNTLCLDDAAATTLAEWGLELEALTGAPQDVEWAQDQMANLTILQSRPIHMPEDGTDPEALFHDQPQDTPAPSNHVAVLLEVGTPASVGISTGPVHHITGEGDISEIPSGSILVTPNIPPSLVHVVHNVKAVLAEHGSKASHFASVAREFGLPLVVGLGSLATTLAQGQTVTVDAYRGVVYDGEVRELLEWQEKQKSRPTFPFQRKMKPLMELISPLTLTDPASSSFAPESCRTYHDLVRFVHEKGTQEMFSLVEAKGRGLRSSKSLEADIPMVMQVLDLGGGLRESAQSVKTVRPEDFLSAPMQAVWSGLSDRDITWSKGLVHVDWERFDQVSGGIFSLKSSLLASYALVAANYAHLLLRFGYHFAVLDAMSGSRPEENHIQFRFKGGGGSPEKKIWRLAMIGRVLSRFNFRVEINEDMLEAKCMRLGHEATQLRLRVTGYLLGCTPLLDMVLESEDHALAMAEEMAKKWQNEGNKNE
ncbi:pyruvate, water dikinase [Desulfonatronum thiosulfatophilum]|uniref:Phosphoenolpyruvate synthase n=1 Tax=Desulfonatronum thiosulfatophilum TaxID=617002 RepID=A0A1G6CZ57_9BACT|nr:PEP/pyruvate-binding domain-containing protein [Desulfonatronum thiosulfatophilum]SDB38129.1 pyruvate, water dikinase [Desulfonatronum thiosulfatophilum]